VFCREIPVNGGDAFFVCSDGVWEALPRPELERLAGLGCPEEAAAEMASVLKGMRCMDNTSFLWLVTG
jgi:serine/threonine protein phosphatase PrpC